MAPFAGAGTSLIRHWETGKASEGPKPGDLSVRATMDTLGGGLVARSTAPQRRSRPSLRPGRWAVSFASLPVLSGPSPAAPLLLAGTLSCSGAAGVAGNVSIVDDAGRYRRRARASHSHRLPDSGHHRTSLRDRRRRLGRRPDDVVRLPCRGAVGSQPRRRHQPQSRGDPRQPSRPGRALQLDTQRRRGRATSSAGIAAVRLNTDELADVGRIARLLGRVSGHTAAADSLVAAFDTALAAATVPPAGARPKSCSSSGSSRR